MRKLIAVAVLVPLVALATVTNRLWSEDQILTRAAPSAVTDGMFLKDVVGYRLTVCAASGQTLSGAGALRAWYYSYESGVWGRNPTLDQTITVTATSCAGAACRCQTFPDFEVVANQGGRVLFATDAVTVSGGTTATVRIHANVEH